MLLTKMEIKKEKEILETRLQWLEKDWVEELSFERILMSPTILFKILRDLGYEPYDSKTSEWMQWVYCKKEGMSNIEIFANGLHFILKIRKAEK